MTTPLASVILLKLHLYLMALLVFHICFFFLFLVKLTNLLGSMELFISCVQTKSAIAVKTKFPTLYWED